MKLSLLFFKFFISLNGFTQYKRPFNELRPSRQVNLDFYTSEFITGIGEKFDKNQLH